MKKPVMKNIILDAVAATLAGLMMLCLFACRQPEPEEPVGELISDADAIARFAELYPLSLEINEIFLGEGLPVAPGEVDDGTAIGSMYVRVDPASGYTSFEDIKAKAELVFSDGYLESRYFMAFEDDNDDGLAPRYAIIEDALKIDLRYESFELNTVLYPETAVVKESLPNAVTLTVDYSITGGESGVLDIRMVFEREMWLLDSPTY